MVLAHGAVETVSVAITQTNEEAVVVLVQEHGHGRRCVAQRSPEDVMTSIRVRVVMQVEAFARVALERQLDFGLHAHRLKLHVCEEVPGGSDAIELDAAVEEATSVNFGDGEDSLDLVVLVVED